MRLDEFSVPDGSFSTADIARMLLFGFDIALSAPPAVDLSTAVLFTATRKGSVIHEVTRKGTITIDQLRGGNR